MARSPKDIEAVREFNRFYTSRLGLTRTASTRPSTRSPKHGCCTSSGRTASPRCSELRAALRIDAGQLSRLLKRMEQQGLVSKHVSPLDARRQQVRLTETASARSRRSTSGRRRDRRAAGRAPGLVDAMQTLRRALEPSAELTHPRPRARRPRLARRAPRRPLRARVRLGPELRATGGEHRRRVRPGPPTARGSPRRDGQRLGAVLCVHEDDTTAKLRTLLVEPQARGLGLGTHAGPRSHPPRQTARLRRPSTLWTNDVLTRRAPDLRARRLHAPARGAEPGVRPRPRRADLVPYPQAHGPRPAEGAPGAAEGRVQGRPEPGADHAQGERHARRGRLLLRRHRAGDRPGRPAPRHRRRRHAPVLRRHAARGARRLRRRHARRRRDGARNRRSKTAKSTPRATSTSEARWAWTKRRRSASKRSA